jgi:hypothetical protein
MTWWVLTLAIVAVALVVTGLIIGADIAYERNETPGGEHADTRQSQRRSEQRPGWYPLWTHAAPPRPFEIPEAHRAMQVHRECQLDDCDRKYAAYRALVRAGRITPARGWPTPSPSLGQGGRHVRG